MPEGAPRAIRIHRASDAVDLAASDFMIPAETAVDTPPPVAHDGESSPPSGAVAKVLVRQTDEEGGFSLVYLWFKSGFPLPRHSHDAECMYYVISGEVVMGNQHLRAGDSFFVPAGAPYAYTAGSDGVEVLEIRHGVRQFNIGFSGQGNRFEAILKAAEVNRARWEAEDVSPTFAANQHV